MDHTKYCPRCKTTKPHTDFNRNRRRSDGCQDICRLCDNEQGRRTRETYRQSNVVAISQTCSVCKIEKPATEFAKSKGRKSGLHGHCRTCAIENAAEWQDANRDRHNARVRARRLIPEIKAKRDARTRSWELRNPDRKRLFVQTRRARVADAINTLTIGEWRDQLALFNGYCGYCVEPHERLQLEHMLPISRGGAHSIDNVIPACGQCNTRKGAKSILEFLRTQLITDSLQEIAA